MKFLKTDRPNNIFYGDLFDINGKGCLIFGSGKTKACRVAGEDIALDFVCLTREGDEVFGHFEMFMKLDGSPDPINQRKRIDYFVRMLDQIETSQSNNVHHGNIISVSYDEFVKLSRFNICFTIGFETLETSPEKRITNFLNLTKNADIKEFIVVPWKSSHEEKGTIIKKHIN
ncbi:hypothetical protein [Paenibacillus sp.]|uniref:hypothetical protein n=1 Tax=Paenibacillus sp. TaxID=58172 RepID=UPI002D3E735E|nr:hypothetical protein [Paenibacillus sp.]HZG86678.1 hypothetical protein [Paenibacillus sp.]